MTAASRSDPLWQHACSGAETAVRRLLGTTTPDDTRWFSSVEDDGEIVACCRLIDRAIPLGDIDKDDESLIQRSTGQRPDRLYAGAALAGATGTRHQPLWPRSR
jgi:hypothetical protein